MSKDEKKFDTWAGFLMGKSFLTSYTTILVTFPDVVIKKNNLKEKSFFFFCLTDEGTITHDAEVQGAGT